MSAEGRLLPASRCPPTVGKLIHSSLPASARLRAGVGHERTLTPPFQGGGMKWHKQRGQCDGCRGAPDFAASSDRSAGIWYFWITCPSGRYPETG